MAKITTVVTPPTGGVPDEQTSIPVDSSKGAKLRKKRLTDLKIARGYVPNHDPAVLDVFETFQRHSLESGLRAKGISLKIAKGVTAQLMSNQATSIMASRPTGMKKIKR
jgi:hypothetical protein